MKASQNETELLISLLAYASSKNKKQLNAAFTAAQKLLSFKNFKLVARDKLNVESLGQATDALANIKPLQKPQLLKACLACLTQDKEYSAQEKELMRAIASTLDCPMPLYTN